MEDFIQDDCDGEAIAPNEETGDDKNRNVGGRPRKEEYDKQDKIHKVFLNLGEDAVANDLLEFHKINDISSLCRKLIREDAVRNEAGLKTMRKERRETLKSMNDNCPDQEQ